MKAYEIHINGEKVATVGLNEGVVSVIANWTFIRSDLAIDPDKDWNAGVSAGGLDNTTEEHLQWFRSDLNVGDEVTLKLVEVDSVDPPLK